MCLVALRNHAKDGKDQHVGTLDENSKREGGVIEGLYGFSSWLELGLCPAVPLYSKGIPTPHMYHQEVKHEGRATTNSPMPYLTAYKAQVSQVNMLKRS
jgi:hypothetical protein